MVLTFSDNLRDEHWHYSIHSGDFCGWGFQVITSLTLAIHSIREMEIIVHRNVCLWDDQPMQLKQKIPPPSTLTSFCNLGESWHDIGTTWEQTSVKCAPVECKAQNSFTTSFHHVSWVQTWHKFHFSKEKLHCSGSSLMWVKMITQLWLLS